MAALKNWDPFLVFSILVRRTSDIHKKKVVKRAYAATRKLKILVSLIIRLWKHFQDRLLFEVRDGVSQGR